MNRISTHTAILGALAFAIAPSLLQLPAWIILWCLALWGYAYVSHRYKRPIMKRYVRLILTVSGICCLIIVFGRHFDSKAYVGLVAIAAGLKPLEIKSQRDRIVTIFLAYFLIIPSLFEANTLDRTFHMLVSVFFTTAVLIQINHPRKHLRANFSLSARIMLQSLPFVIILFFLFPRLQGSLWGVTVQPKGLSGFTDHLTPESLSTMARSKEIAFRAQFPEKTPPPEDRYWRGVVFPYFNDDTWSRGNPWMADSKTLTGDHLVEYTLAIEPHNKRWLFALDIPIDAPYGAIMLRDRTLFLYRALKQRTTFRIKSYTAYRIDPFASVNPATRALPDSMNLKTLALAKKIKESSHTPEEIVEKALSYLRDNHFQYSLNPPGLTKTFVDDFLFITRKGYCGHYASAFAFLMRAAGIPSRIVGGYLGGEINPYGNYLIVRQADAHVWVEVWLPVKGWVRVDPTSVVVPERVEQGSTQALPPEERKAFLSFRDLGPFSKLVEQIRFGWDALNNQWNIRILGYTHERQKSFLQKFNINAASYQGIVQAGMLTLGLIVMLSMLFGIGIMKRSTGSKQSVLQIYTRFCSKLGRIGLRRAPNQGPSDYAGMIISHRNDLKEQVKGITDLYIHLRYNRGGGIEDLNRFNLLVKKFSPQKRNSR